MARVRTSRKTTAVAQGQLKVLPPGAIREHFFRSWEDYKSGFAGELFGDGPFQRGRYLFRGHSDPSWKLTTTFDRMFAGQPKGRRVAISESLLSSFKQALEGYPIPPEARSNDSMMLALGQHYGLPTRLLDWTESPYIAAFFAYNRRTLWGVGDSQIVIWALDTVNPIWSAQYGVEIVDVPSFGNERIRNQAGKFTLARTPFSSLEEYVAAHEEDGTALIRFFLPASEATKALADLDAMGIHHGVVYPEIEGSAQMALFRTVMKHGVHIQSQEGTRPI
jgi:hypothetical protein